MPSPVTTSSGGNPHITSLYNATSPSEVQRTYDAWATDFNADVSAQNYIAPTYIANAILAHLPKNATPTTQSILDAGCGTGLSGAALHAAGFKTLDGCDLSPKMLDVARKTNFYTSLTTADLSQKIPQFSDSSYDIITCVGTLTHGHVGPVPAITEFIRIVKSGGLVVSTVLDDIWESHGYEAECERLQKAGELEILSTESKPYREKAGVSARIVVLRKR